MCLPYLQFYVSFNMSTSLGSLCTNLLWINQMVLKMWLWTWTHKKREHGPNFQSKGHLVGQQPRKRRSTGEKLDFTQKRGLSKIPKKNGFCHKFGWQFVKSFVYFEQPIYPKKLKNIWVIVWQICNFWSKFKTHGIFGWQSKLFRGNCVRSEHKKGVLRALHSVPSNMGVPPWVNIKSQS